MASDETRAATINSHMVTVETVAATLHFSGGCVSCDSSDSDDDVQTAVTASDCDVHTDVTTPDNTGKSLVTTAVTDPNPVERVVPPIDKNANCTSKRAAEGGAGRFNPFNELCPPDEPLPILPNAESTPVCASASSDSWTLSSGWYADCPVDGASSDLGISEDHFSQPEAELALTSVDDLETAIAQCRRLVVVETERTERRRSLVHRLIQLRMRLAEVKEPPEEGSVNLKQVIGHQFEERNSKSSKHYCEKCNCVIWGPLQQWYRCTACGFCCHAKCLNFIIRSCANAKVKEGATYILQICPERGLSAQNYRCMECRAAISYQSGFSEARRCDYTGNYYCALCHWNDRLVLPALVLHNWDFEPRKVCRASKQLLRILYKRAVIRVHDVNPMIFSYVEELNDVKRLREELLIMKQYFLSCQAALDSKLLLQLRDRQHFVENSDMYSLKDLVDVATDILLPELARIHATFAQHIKTDCQLCRAKGHICELCQLREVLFPFDNIAVVCSTCSAVLHRHCYVLHNRICPHCERVKQASVDSPDTG